MGKGHEKSPQPHENDTISGDNGEGVPPVPMPNTEVKTFSADGTWLDTARESRSPPDSKEEFRVKLFFFSLCSNADSGIMRNEKERKAAEK